MFAILQYIHYKYIIKFNRFTDTYMRFLVKILFAAFVFVIVGGITYMAIVDVNIASQNLVKTVPQHIYLP